MSKRQREVYSISAIIWVVHEIKTGPTRFFVILPHTTIAVPSRRDPIRELQANHNDKLLQIGFNFH